MILGMRTVVYKVRDLTAAKTWYATVLGVKPYFDEPFYVGFAAGGFELGLDPDMAGVTGSGGVVAYWGVASCDEAYRRLLELGGRPHGAVQEVGGGIKVASVLDPSDNVFGIVENPHFSIAVVG